MKNILFLGDSLTAGYGLSIPSLESLPALLQLKIDQAQLPYKIINAGISGDTSRGGLERIDLLLNQTVDIFVLELGANDGLRGVPPATTQKNLQAIVDKVKSKYPQAKLLLLGMEIPVFLGGKAGAEFRTIFRTVASQNNMALYPFLLDGVVGLREFSLADGLHPSAAGYKIIAERVWKVLETLL